MRMLLMAIGLSAASAGAADLPGALAGDDALTCDQIYAQGMAESQRDQQAIAQRNAQMGAQSAATAALITGAVVTGGALAPAAQAAAEAGADRQMAMLGSPQQVNARKQRLRALWTEKKCVAPGASSTPATEEAMTCEQIAAELVPYAQQMTPGLQAYGASSQQLYAQSRELNQQRRVEDALLAPVAAAGAVDPTGASKRAYEAMVIAQAAKRHAENEALANSPLAKENKAQLDAIAAQGKQMQGNDRLGHLLQLGHEKHCDGK
jgi:hypothetical protein